MQSSLTVEMLFDEEVFSLLEDQQFQKQWQVLYQNCPWTTGFQTYEFVSTWYSVYRKPYRPILLISHLSDGKLAGILPLARLNNARDIVVAGAWQAEYQVWLSEPSVGSRFIVEAIKLFRQRFPNRSLAFQFLPPLVPTDWLSSSEGTDLPVVLDEHPRPIMSLKNMKPILASLRKKSNKSRFNRLKKLGRLRFERITEASHFALFFDDIVDYYDFRQGAKSDVLPFRDDQFKRSFHLALFEKPGLLHVSILRVDDHIVAAHMGICSKNMVHLGIIVYSPFEAKHSPGKLHILLLAKMLSEEGYGEFDLTPSGTYKDRFATMHDRVFSLTIFASQRKRSLSLIKRKTRSSIRGALEAVNIKPEAVKSLISEICCNGIGRIPLRFANILRHKLWNRVESRVYAFDHEFAHPTSDTILIMKDCIPDLLKYTSDRTCQSKKNFLMKSIIRFGQGEHVYTFVQGDELLYYCWVAENVKDFHFEEVEQSLDFPPGTAILYDFFISPHTPQNGLFVSFILHVLNHIAVSTQLDNFFIATTGDNEQAKRMIETLGFSHEASLFKEVCFGRTRRWSILRPSGSI